MTNLSTIIDQIGDLECEIAKLERQVKAGKAALAELTAGKYEGERFALTISESTRESPDSDLKAKIEEFRATLSHQYLTAHTVKTPVRSHRFTVRKDALAA